MDRQLQSHIGFVWFCLSDHERDRETSNQLGFEVEMTKMNEWMQLQFATLHSRVGYPYTYITFRDETSNLTLETRTPFLSQLHDTHYVYV